MRTAIRAIWNLIQWAALVTAITSTIVGIHLFMVANSGVPERGHLETPKPLTAPISGDEVCGFHICVVHPSGSTCTGSERADDLQLVTESYSGPVHTRWFERFDWESQRNVERQSEPGELLAPVESERITGRCRHAYCTWTEHVIPCGVTQDVVVDHGLFRTYLRQTRRLGLELMALQWLLIIGFLGGLIVGKRPLERTFERIGQLLRRNRT